MACTYTDEELMTSEQSGRADTRCEIRRGEFVGKVEPQGDRYAFTVRDLRRERPTIHGFEHGYDQALFVLKQVMTALDHRP